MESEINTTILSDSIVVCRDPNWSFEPNHDDFLTLTKCFFVPKLNQRMSTSLIRGFA